MSLQPWQANKMKGLTIPFSNDPVAAYHGSMFLPYQFFWINLLANARFFAQWSMTAGSKLPKMLLSGRFLQKRKFTERRKARHLHSPHHYLLSMTVGSDCSTFQPCFSPNLVCPRSASAGSRFDFHLACESESFWCGIWPALSSRFQLLAWLLSNDAIPEWISLILLLDFLHGGQHWLQVQMSSSCKLSQSDRRNIHTWD